MKLLGSAIMMVLPMAAIAIDVSPYRPGQTVDAEQAKELQKRFKERPQQDWLPPQDNKAIDASKAPELVKYGIQVLDKTADTIGPKVADEKMRYSGNGLNCSSCHLKGPSGLPGTKYLGVPFVNMNNDYPNFRSRDMNIGTAADRVNGCMTRSMGDGKSLPDDSREMKAILAYFDWLATGVKPQESMKGMGLPQLELPARAANVDAGKQVYVKYCQSCHGVDALGQPAPQSNGYLFPPLAGEDSYNDGAGMSRQIKATRFIYGNMPLGVDARKPALTVDQAYDVAAYMLSLPRKSRPNRNKDFPNPDFRPADYPVPAYFGDDKAALEKAKRGPYR
ncbi:MAG: c-type cytochrome [bacterium]